MAEPNEPKKSEEMTTEADELAEEALDGVVGGAAAAGERPKPQPQPTGTVRPAVRDLLTKSS
jgi:hypothetical protein